MELSFFKFIKCPNNNQESYKDVIFLSVSNRHPQALIFCISLFNIKTEDQHLAQKKGRAI